MDAAHVRMPVIVGPTAGGKTALSIGLARELSSRGMRAEIVSADAFQVYRGMDIGTAKPTEDERAGVPHHLIDIAEPTERFTLMDWLGAAERVIAEVRGLVEAGRLGEQAGQALGYKQVAAALAGRVSMEDAIERVKIETRRFAKNQRTWLRRLRASGGVWIEGAAAGEASGAAAVERVLGSSVRE